MFLFGVSNDSPLPTPTEAQSAIALDGFEDNLRLDGIAATRILEVLRGYLGEEIRWHFTGEPQIQRGWKQILQVLESGPGWSFPPRRSGFSSISPMLLSVQFMDRNGNSLDPLSFGALPTEDAASYVLSTAYAAPSAHSDIRRLASELRAVLQDQQRRGADEERLEPLGYLDIGELRRNAAEAKRLEKLDAMADQLSAKINIGRSHYLDSVRHRLT